MKKHISNFLACILVGALIVVQCVAGEAKSIQTVDRHVEEAVLTENWEKVSDLLASVDTQTPSPVLRLIKAHACLALNRNNESLCLFLSVSSEDELKQWQKYTDAFAAQNAQKAIAHYFKGDALARLRQWDTAQMAFNKALELHPNHPLILNARGITYAAKEEWDLALIDFHIATQVNPSFADAHASLGALFIQKSDGADGALEWSNRALESSPDFVLALYIRGCAKFVLNDWDGAQKDFQDAREKTACISGILAENIVKIVDYMNGREVVELARFSKEETGAGTTLEMRFDTLKQNPNQWNTNRFASYLRENPADMNRGMSMVKEYSAQNPEWGNRIKSYASNGVKWNTEMAPGITNVVGGISGQYKGVGYDFGKWAKNQSPITRGNLDVFRNFEKNLSTVPTYRNPGGVKTDVSASPVDRGNWPFVTYYGLLYNVKAQGS